MTEPIQYPEFWTEEWIRIAIDELDKRNMSPEELLNYEMTLSANAIAVWNEKRKIEKIKTEAVEKALVRGKLSPVEIAEDNSVSLDLVLDVQKKLNEK